MSSMRQQWSAKNIFCKQKSIDDKTLSSDSRASSKKILRKQLSVDHVTSSIRHTPTTGAINFNNLVWQNTSNQQVAEPSLKIVTTSAIKKRAQFAASAIGANSSIIKQELLSSCLSKTMKSAGSESSKPKDKININIFLSQDIADDGCSEDNESAPQNTASKPAATFPSNSALKSPASSETPTVASGRLSVSARRAQFQASRRIMSAPIRPLNIDDINSKNKRKPARKKKVIRDKDVEESPDDEFGDELEDLKPVQPAPQRSSKKHPPMRSRSVLGCDQIGIETMVSMLNSESDSEKEEAPSQPSPPLVKIEAPRINRSNMLRKTVSFQEDDGQLQSPTAVAPSKDVFTFRRASVVPFAGRMRNTRSLFGQEICNLYLNNSVEKSSELKNENDLNSSNQQNEEVKEKPKSKKISDEASDEKKTQETLSQPREQECWRLYEKMKKTGLNVSYDTILRGILKPSELRLLEKQKKLLGDIDEKPLEQNETNEQEVN